MYSLYCRLDSRLPLYRVVLNNPKSVKTGTTQSTSFFKMESTKGRVLKHFYHRLLNAAFQNLGKRLEILHLFYSLLWILENKKASQTDTAHWILSSKQGSAGQLSDGKQLVPGQYEDYLRLPCKMRIDRMIRQTVNV